MFSVKLGKSSPVITNDKVTVAVQHGFKATLVQLVHIQNHINKKLTLPITTTTF